MLPLLMVNDAYRTITRLGYFDAIDGNKVIDMNDSIRDIPNKMFGYLCAEHGVNHKLTDPYTPQHNGIV